jgi:2-polyprenyl-6-methoxyphenol hydroxylase-like FAD-dependent oxidoreductase
LVGVGGLESSSFLTKLPDDHHMPAPSSPCVMTFGPQGFVGYSPADAGLLDQTAMSNDMDYVPSYGSTAMWWSTYEMKEEPDRKNIDLEAVRKQLLERHGDWKDPTLHKFITEGTIIGLYASYTVDKLPEWTKDCVILTGDAAHTIPSTAGQGVSQALEDAHALALLLAHNLRAENHASVVEAIKTAGRQFVKIRKPRVDGILDVARRMDNHKRKKGIVEEWITYGAMWAITRLTMKSWANQLFNYDVQTEVDKCLQENGH